MRYRRHTASSAFSDRMWRSREIYAAKLAAAFPDDPDLSRFYVRDLIAPRFFRSGVHEYLRHLARGRFDLCEKAHAVAKQNFGKCRYPLRQRLRWHVILELMRYPPLFRRIYRVLRDDPRFA